MERLPIESNRGIEVRIKVKATDVIAGTPCEASQHAITISCLTCSTSIDRIIYEETKYQHIGWLDKLLVAFSHIIVEIKHNLTVFYMFPSLTLEPADGIILPATIKKRTLIITLWQLPDCEAIHLTLWLK